MLQHLARAVCGKRLSRDHNQPGDLEPCQPMIAAEGLEVRGGRMLSYGICKKWPTNQGKHASRPVHAEPKIGSRTDRMAPHVYQIQAFMMASTAHYELRACSEVHQSRHLLA